MKKIITFLFILLFLVGCSVVNKHSNEIIEMISNGDFSDVNQKISEIENDESLSEDKIAEIKNSVFNDISLRIDQLIEEFKDDKIEVSDFVLNLDEYNSINIEQIKEKVSSTKSNLKELIKSREAYILGLENFEKKRYENSLDNFLKVIDTDKKFDNAMEYVTETKKLLLIDIRENLKSKEQLEMFESAYIYLKDRESYFKDETEYNDLLEEYRNMYIEHTKNVAIDHRKNNKFQDALKELKDLKQKISGNNEINDLIKEIEKEYETFTETRKNELLAKMNIKYDSMNDITRISPKGTDAFTLNIPNNGFIFFPMIQVGSKNINEGIAILSVATGFSQDDWVFMDRIQFNVDGNRFSWEIGFLEAQTEVGWGAIYEWVLKNNFDQPSLITDLEKMANAKSVELRYDGEKRDRDEKLSKTQIQQIKDILELYEFLNGF